MASTNGDEDQDCNPANQISIQIEEPSNLQQPLNKSIEKKVGQRPKLGSIVRKGVEQLKTQPAWFQFSSGNDFSVKKETLELAANNCHFCLYKKLIGENASDPWLKTLKGRLVHMCWEEKRTASKEFQDLLSTIWTEENANHLNTNTSKEMHQKVLDWAANLGRVSHVQHLLSLRHKPNMSSVVRAAGKGNLCMLKVLANNCTPGEEATELVDEASGNNILHILLDVKNAKTKECLRWLLNEDLENAQPAQPSPPNTPTKDGLQSFDNIENNLSIGRIINALNARDETPIMVASQKKSHQNKWGQNEIAWLLSAGAEIDNLSVEDAENFLDKCIERNPDQDELTLNFSWQSKSNENSTKLLKDLSSSEDHNDLLKHPVVEVYFNRRWEYHSKTSGLRLFRFFFMFTGCITWYILTRFGGVRMRNYSWYDALYPDQGTNTETKLKNCSEQIFCEHLKDFWNYDNFSDVLWGWETQKTLPYIVLIFITVSATIVEVIYIHCFSREVVRNFTKLDMLDDVFHGLHILMIVVLGTGSLRSTLAFSTAYLIFCELIQLHYQWRDLKYFKSKENLFLDLPLLGLVTILIFLPATSSGWCSCDGLRHIAALILLLTWIKMAILAARHPLLSKFRTYLAMLNKVLESALPALLFFSMFLFAFALCFYIVLHEDTPEMLKHNRTWGYFGMKPRRHLDGDYIYFDSPWTSVVKTIAMFAGELEFGDIHIDPSSGLSMFTFLFIIVFVVLMMITLMNLLNGLAVSDITDLTKRAEIVTIQQKLEVISYLEQREAAFEFIVNLPVLLWRKLSGEVEANHHEESSTSFRVSKDENDWKFTFPKVQKQSRSKTFLENIFSSGNMEIIQKNARCKLLRREAREMKKNTEKEELKQGQKSLKKIEQLEKTIETVIEERRLRWEEKEKKKISEKGEKKMGQESLEKIEKLENMIEAMIEDNKKGQNKIENLEKMMGSIMEKLEISK